VLGNRDSGEDESFSHYLLEYPQYSRPETWHGKQVPEVLLSGNHALVEEWRLEQSLEQTKRLRPELYEKWAEENEDYFIRKAKREERQRRKLEKQEKLGKQQKS
jgi:tRNA (guanine37-N1)-methyltransferase